MEIEIKRSQVKTALVHVAAGATGVLLLAGAFRLGHKIGAPRRRE